MESLSYRYGANARHGGMDIVLSLTPDEVAALGIEGTGELAGWFDTSLWALAMFRNGANPRGPIEADPSSTDVTAEQMAHVVHDLDRSLLPRLQGLRDAAIRRHQELGGSINSLATAMDVAKSTAQSRRNVVLKGSPSDWERWTVQGGPQDREHCLACGHPSRPTDPLVTTADDNAVRIHLSHTQDPRNGFHGTPYTED